MVALLSSLDLLQQAQLQSVAASRAALDGVPQLTVQSLGRTRVEPVTPIDPKALAKAFRAPKVRQVDGRGGGGGERGCTELACVLAWLWMRSCNAASPFT